MRLIRTWADVPLIIDTEMLSDILNIDGFQVRKKLRDGVIPGIKIGSKWYVEKTALMKKFGVSPNAYISDFSEKGT